MRKASAVAEFLSLRAQPRLFARIGAAGGDFSGNRHESPHDKRWLNLISHLLGDALIELDFRCGLDGRIPLRIVARSFRRHP
jgi:hypothetical protein